MIDCTAQGQPGDPVNAQPDIPDHELLRLIGHGSYGEVWLARNVMGTLRAIKLVRREQFDSDGPYEREFSGIKRYEPISRSGDGLVHLLHVGRNDIGGYFYYVMELADDATSHQSADTVSAVDEKEYTPCTLRSKLRTLQSLPLHECVELGIALAEGLGHLHRAGLVHRDVKPSNVIFVEGKAKLADVGLVSVLGESRSFVGTEGYIPPEGPGSPAADLYGLGKVLYEVATGRDRNDYPMLPQLWMERGNSDGLEFMEVVLRACEGNPDRRYETAEEMHSDLALLRGGRSVRRVRALERHARWLKHISAAGLAALLLAVGWIALAHHREIEARTRAAAEEQLRLRAEGAERQAKELLFLTRIARGEAEVRGGRTDAPFIALEAASEAAALNKNSAEARSLAASALALPGFREVRRWSGGGFFRRDVCLNDDVSIVAVVRAPDAIEFLRTFDNESLFTAQLENRKAARLGPFNHSGDRILISMADGSIEIWNLGLRRAEGRLSKAPPMRGASFSADDRWLAVSRWEDRVEVWRIDEAPPRLAYEIARGANSLAMSPVAGKFAFITRDTKNVVEVDLATLAERTIAEAPDGVSFYPLAWHPSGEWIAAGGSDFAIHLVESKADHPQLRLLQGHQARLVSVQFSSDGRWLFSSAWDGTTRIWNLVVDKEASRAPAWGNAAFTSKDGQWLGRLDEDANAAVLCECRLPKVCRLLAADASPIPFTRTNWPRAMAFSPDGRFLAAGGSDGLSLFDRDDNRSMVRLPGRHDIKSLVWEPRGLVLLEAGPTGAGRRNLSSRAPEEVAIGKDRETIFENLGGFRNVTQSGDGTLTAVLTSENPGGFIGGVIHLREAGGGMRIPPQGDRFFNNISLSRDGRWLAATRYQANGIFLWDLRAGAVPRRLPSTAHAELCFSPDSQFLVAGDKTHIRRWRCEDAVEIWTVLRDAGNPIACPVLWSPDGSVIAAATFLSRAALLDAETGALITRLDDPQPYFATVMISSFAFSPDGTQLAIGRTNCGVQLWDLQLLRQELAARGLEW